MRTTPDAAQSEPGSFAARVADRRVNLLRLVMKGVPPREYLPASEGMLLRGKRHLIVAPWKTGKSIAMQTHWVDMALAGARIVVLDRENGSDLYAERLRDIFAARGLSLKQKRNVGRNLKYYEFPELRRTDAAALVDLLTNNERPADLVVFDAQRMFLTDFGLREGDADDYAAFMGFVVDPLFRAGVATVILDNTGHRETGRARGSITKSDLNEVMLSMEAVRPFDQEQKGVLKLSVERSRFGNRGTWTMTIGGHEFGRWEPQNAEYSRPDFLNAVTEALRERQPLGQDKIIRFARQRGVGIGTGPARRQLAAYVESEAIPVVQVPGGYELRRGA